MPTDTAKRFAAAFSLLLHAAPAALAQLGPGPEATLIRVHAYEGVNRPAAQIATVFAPYGPAAEMTFICSVDGKSYLRMGWSSTCPSVVYLLPGAHQLTLDFHLGGARSTTTMPIRAEAGKSYVVRAVKSGDRRATFSISSMPEGFVLTYKDIVPGYFAKYGKQNSRVDPADAK